MAIMHSLCFARVYDSCAALQTCSIQLVCLGIGKGSLSGAAAGDFSTSAHVRNGYTIIAVLKLTVGAMLLPRRVFF